MFERNRSVLCLFIKIVKTSLSIPEGRGLTRQAAALAAAVFAATMTSTGAIEMDVRRDTTVEATEKVIPSVVNIATTTIVEYRDFYQDLLDQFYGRRTPGQLSEQPSSIGSGVIIDEDGYILTNFHVLQRANRIYVKLWNGREYEAEPVFVATTQKDVALLKLRAKAGEKFPAIKLAKDDDLLLGETVLALGNPYGLGMSVTRGILSSKNRRPTSGKEPLGTQDWLQTDADINPGNSGGPLINLRGELIGINVAVYRQDQGMGVGFAIPVKQISSALVEFFAPEIMPGLWFGATVTGWRVPLSIASVQTGSPAAKAGLRTGQRIVRVNGETPRGLAEFNRLLTSNPNHTATLQVQQAGEARNAEVKLIPFGDLIEQKLGLALLNLTPQIAARFEVRQDEGLFIEKVLRNGPADKAQLQPGFLLTGVDGQPTGDLLRVVRVLSEKKAGDTVRLTVVVPRRLGGSYVEFRAVTVDVTVR
jgi:S1-C subfamily serine protease